jgi:PAS domain S-box-containing protein
MKVQKEQPSVNRQIIFLFLSVSFLLIVLGITNYRSVSNFEKTVIDIKDTTIFQLELISEIQSNVGFTKINAQRYFLTQDPELRKRYASNTLNIFQENTKKLAELENSLTNEEERYFFQTMMTLRKVYYKKITYIIEGSDQTFTQENIVFEEEEIRPAFIAYNQALQDFFDLIQDNSYSRTNQAYEDASALRRISVLLIIIGIIILLILSLNLFKIVRQLKNDYEKLFLETKQRKQAQNELKELNEKLEAIIAERTAELEDLHILIDLSDDPVIIRNLNDEITFWNKGAENLYGCKKEEAISKVCHVFLNREFEKPYEGINEELLENGFWYGEITSNVNNVSKTVFSKWTARRDEKGNPVSILEIDHDITEQKKYEKEILELNKDLRKLNLSKDKIFSVISHDLRSPVAGLIGSANILVRNIETMKQEEIKKFISIIKNNAHKMLDQLNVLVEWAKSQHQKHSFLPHNLKLCFQVQNSIKLLNENANQKNIELLNEVPIELYVKADLRMLESILQNLIANSIKFTPKNGTITIKAKEKGETVEISVSDTGIGMTKEQKENLFSETQEKSTKGTESETGSGLGLLLVKDFVIEHKGKIGVESEPDKGTTVYFTLPKGQAFS